MLGLLLVACQSPPPERLNLVGDLSPTDAHAATFTVSGRGPVELGCATDRGADAHRLTSAQEPPAPITVRGLLADTTYRCAATRGNQQSEPVVLTTPPVPDGLPLPAVTVPGDPAEVGFHLVNLAHMEEPSTGSDQYFRDEFLVILDAEGRPRWQYAGEGGGDIDATWLGGDRILFGGFGADASTAPTILTLDGDIVLRAPDMPGSSWQVPSSWHHDAGIAVDGESLWVLAAEQIPAADDPDTTWEGFVIQRLDPGSGEVRWSWSAMDDGVATGALEAGDRHDATPYHANAVWDAEEADGPKVYVSLRNMSQVLRIDVATRRVDLRIGLGGDLTLLDADGAPAEDADWFFGQHDVKRIGDRLVVYDNGLGRTAVGGAPYSRALVLVLDEDAGTARIDLSWRGADDWSAPAWGGLDRRPDGTLDLAIGHFWWVNADATLRSALAVLRPDAAGGAALAWRLDFPARETALYRSDRIDGCAIFALAEACP